LKRGCAKHEVGSIAVDAAALLRALIGDGVG
jgi:hypothetical protein